jgi:D-sedoheptulose 7-phosphate isomerase
VGEAGHEDAVRAVIEQSREVTRALLDDAPRFAAEAADRIVGCYRAGGKVLLCGNGGSAADAMHLAAELLGRFKLERDALPAISLSDNVSAVTAIGNDYDYGSIFSRQVRGLGVAGDVLLGLSTSGESDNVVRAVDEANGLGMVTIGLTRAGGTRLARAADLCLEVPSHDTARVQESSMLVGHAICELVERSLAS